MSSDASAELHTIWIEAKAQIKQGDYDKAIEIYKYVLIRYSDNDIAVEHANAYLGDVYLRLRQLDLAQSHIKKAIDVRPDNPTYHYLFGFTYSLRSQWGKAIGKFEVAVNKEPDNDEYLRGLGWALHCAGDKARGLDYLHRAIDLEPTNVNIMNDLAAAYLSSLQFDKAREYAEKVMRIAPDNNVARDILDNIDRFQGDLGQLGEA